jgi:hypothetical protein
LVTQIIDTLTTSIAALDHSLDGHGHHEWTSCGPLIRQLLNQLSDEDAHLAPTLRTLEELDTCLATAATRLGLTVIDDHHERQLTQPRIAP